MLRKTLVALGVATAAAKNCGGALSIDPRYCVGSPDGVNPYCTATSLEEGDTVPLRIRMTNNANYEDPGTGTVYVPGVLQGGKHVQIVFACLGGSECKTGSGDALSFPLPATVGPLGGELAGSVKWHEDIGGSGQGATFSMGPCPHGGPHKFGGVDICNDPEAGFEAIAYYPNGGKGGGEGGGGEGGGEQMPSEEAKQTACGCVTLGADPIPVAGDVVTTIANIYMKANKYLDVPITVHISADEGMLKTTGEICEPEELTASGTGTAQGEYIKYSPPPPPPPPSPPPPPPPPEITRKTVCVKYNKCHWCDELPAGACLYAGDMDGPCLEKCSEVPSEWLFDKKWGQCSSLCPVSVSKDPHLHLPHGGRADFRGKDNTVFNLLSAKDVAFNVLFEQSDFAWATRLVHGTKMAAGYWVITTRTGKALSVEYAAEKFDPVALVHEEGHPDVQVRAGTPALVVDDVIVSMVGKTLTVRTGSWHFTASTSPYPFGKLETNKNKVLLDVAIQPLYNPDTDAVAPHGILGQSYDQDKLAVDGKLDEETKGESTTAAQAEGAIEGTWEEYIVPSKFSTAFKYSRFGLAKAAPRDVSKLAGAKRAATAGAVGVADVLAASK